MECHQRFISLLFEHVRCWIADCCLFALPLGYEIKSLYLLLESYVFVCARLFVCSCTKYQNTNFTCGNFVCKFVFCGFCGHLWSGFSGATVSMQVPEGVGLKFCGGNKKMVKLAERMN